MKKGLVLALSAAMLILGLAAPVRGDTIDVSRTDVGADAGLSAYQPDARIKRSGGPLRGNDIYNTTSEGQTVALTPPSGSVRRVYVSVQNDGTTSDSFSLETTGTTPTGYQLRYFLGRSDVELTAAVESDTLVTPVLAPGQVYRIRVRVVTTTQAAPASTLTRRFTFTSENVGVAQDQVRLTAAAITVDPEKDFASSISPSISGDGRFVAFQSNAGGINHVYVFDRLVGGTQLVSMSSDGTEGNSGSSDPVISADGRYVAFKSFANNLVAGDTNGDSNVPNGADVFVHDRQTGMTTRVSVSSAGDEADGASGGLGNAISGDGRFVVFWSAATDLVAGDTNGIEDVFVHDRQTAVTTRVSVATGGAQQTGSLGSLERGAATSGDGRYVVFLSLAADLVAGDTNGWADVFMHDRQTGTTTRVSVASNGTQGDQHSFDPAISADGRYVTFMSSASNLVANDANPCNPPSVGCSVPTAIDVFVRDTQTNTTTLISKATDGTQANFNPSSSCRQLAISSDGRFVAFCSASTNLVAGDTNSESDIFVHDRTTGETTRVNIATDGTQSDDSSHDPVLSADGRYVGFWSWSGALASGDTALRSPDVFIRDRQTSETTRISDGL